MGFYPVLIDLAKHPPLIIGGNQEAENKVMSLLPIYAPIKVVSEQVTETLRILAQEERIVWIPRRVTEDDIQKAGVVILTDAGIPEHHDIIRWATRYHVLLNVTDQPDDCDFYSTSHFRRGDLVVSVSTGGKAPILARALRLKLQQQIGPEFSQLVAHIARRRRLLRGLYPVRHRREILKRMVDELLNQPIFSVSSDHAQTISNHGGG